MQYFPGDRHFWSIVRFYVQLSLSKQNYYYLPLIFFFFFTLLHQYISNMFSTRPIIRPISLLQHQCRFRSFSTFQAGDFCMLRELKSNRKYLVGPLEEGQHKDHKGGIIPHTQLMGMDVRSTVRTHNGMFEIK